MAFKRWDTALTSHRCKRTGHAPNASALTLPGLDGQDAIDSVAADRGATLPKLRRQLHGDLENIVARTLRKSASERYQTVDALADDLRRFRAHEPVSARADTLSYRCAKFMRRRRGVVAAGLIIALAVAGGVIGTATQARRAEGDAQPARYQRDRALSELAGVEAMEEFMTVLLASKADKPFTVSELLLRGEALARRQFAGAPALRARLLLLLSNLTCELAEQDRTMALLREARSAVAGTEEKALGALIDCSIATTLAGEPDAAKAAAMFAAALSVVIHGALDYRVPDQQGLAYYNTLEAKGVAARLVGFPDENHWILKPRSSKLWYAEYFAWLKAHDTAGKRTKRRARKSSD